MLWSPVFGTCILVLAFNTVPALMESKTGKYPHGGGTGGSYILILPPLRHHELQYKKADVNHKGYFARKRRKRVANIIGYGVFVGMRAVRTLLSGAKEVRSHRMFFKQFEKPGDYSQTLKDFYSVKPTHVEDFELPGVVEGKTGRVGDRTILIESTGDLGKPQMEIYHSIGTALERVDRIIYTN